jgi:hypothetical protein
MYFEPPTDRSAGQGTAGVSPEWAQTQTGHGPWRSAAWGGWEDVFPDGADLTESGREAVLLFRTSTATNEPPRHPAPDQGLQYGVRCRPCPERRRRRGMVVIQTPMRVSGAIVVAAAPTLCLPADCREKTGSGREDDRRFVRITRRPSCLDTDDESWLALVIPPSPGRPCMTVIILFVS